MYLVVMARGHGDKTWESWDWIMAVHPDPDLGPGKQEVGLWESHLLVYRKREQRPPSNKG